MKTKPKVATPLMKVILPGRRLSTMEQGRDCYDRVDGAIRDKAKREAQKCKPDDVIIAASEPHPPVASEWVVITDILSAVALRREHVHKEVVTVGLYVQVKLSEVIIRKARVGTPKMQLAGNSPDSGDVN